jgi:hypothetical protein
MRAFRFAAGLALALSLAGCLVSEGPLFDKKSARSAPIAAGDYSICTREGNGAAEDCTPVKIAVEPGKLTVITSPEGDRVEARFARAGKGYVGQLMSPGDAEAHYYYGAKSGGVFVMKMMWCKHAPDALKDRLVAKGALALEGDGETCRALSRDAVTEFAVAYSKGDVEKDGAEMRFIRLKKAS